MGFLMHPNDTQYPPGPPWGPGRGTCLLAPPAHCAAPTYGLPVLLASYILPVWGKVLRLFTSCEGEGRCAPPGLACTRALKSPSQSRESLRFAVLRGSFSGFPGLPVLLRPTRRILIPTLFYSGVSPV